MRTALVLVIIFLSLPVALFRPFYGTLLWSWAAYFRPQDLAYGAAGHRLSLYIALATCAGVVIGLLTGRERLGRVITRETVLVLLMLGVLAVVCENAMVDRERAWGKFGDYWKIFLMTFLTAALITSRARLRMMAWAVAMSLGALGLKGGILGALRGARLTGPGGFLLDNNDFALALNMALPMLYYLAWTEERRIHRWLLGATTGCTALAVVLTHSRGGFLGLCAVSIFLALKSRRKAAALAGLGFLGVMGVALVPIVAPEYLERIQTISEYGEDTSAQGRFNAWATCWNIGLDRPLVGVGPRNLDLPETYARYSPRSSHPLVAHNIYFQTLSDGGFTLFFLFTGLLAATYLSLVRLRRRTPDLPENQWFIHYCHMFEVSLLAYAVSGFFLSRNDFDLYYHIVGIVVAMKVLAPAVVVRPETGAAAGRGAAGRRFGVRPRPARAAGRTG